MAESETVNIVINAVTQAAEDALEEVGDQMTQMGAEARTAALGTDEAADQLDDLTTSALLSGEAMDSIDDDTAQLALAMYALADSSDEAADQMDDATTSALGFSGAAGALTGSLSVLNFRLHGISAAMMGVLLPALAAVLSTLVPLTATLGGLAAAAASLAGAFGAVVGSGLVAWGQELAEVNQKDLALVKQRIRELERLEEAQGSLTERQKEELETLEKRQDKLEEATSITGALAMRFSDVVAEIKPMIAAFGEQFIPLIVDAVNAIPELVSRILDAIGGMDAFKNALRDAGAAAMTAIPQMVGAMFDLAQRALPALIDVGSWLLENGGDIFDAMLETTREVVPILMDLGSAFMDALPAINDLGTATLNSLVPALADAFRGFQDLSESVNWQQLFESLALSEEEMGALSAGIGSLIQGIQENMPLLRDLGAAFKNVIVPAVGAALNILGKLVQAFGELSLGEQKALLTGLAAAIGILGGPITALAAGIAIVAINFDELKAAAQAAMEFITNMPQHAIIAFAQMASAVSTVAIQIENALRSHIAAAINWAIGALESFANMMIRTVNQLIRSLQGQAENLPGINADDLQTLQQVDFDNRRISANRRETQQRRRAGAVAASLAVTLDVDTSGGGPLDEFIEERVRLREREKEAGDARFFRRQNVGSGI